jgi:isochorismate synthase
MVQQGISLIESNHLEKIVPSRQARVALTENFDVIDAFQKLCEANPNAFISWVSIPGVGDWLGASPEILVSIYEQTIFKTVALAGTQPYHEGVDLRSVAWTQKEIEEQALVNRYIISCFKKIRLREYEEHGPKTVVAGNLMHLRTDFTVDMKATNFPQLGSVMLQLLHPTSAVCGMPLEQALDFLKQHEGYDRKFYAGHLGPVNINDAINIFVNLRCMQLFKDEAILYAEAGVTIDSVPEKEWNETVIKLKTLLKAIS